MWKLLYKLRYSIKYMIYILLFLIVFRILHLISVRFDLNYKDILPGFRLFSYDRSQLIPKYILIWQPYYLIADKTYQKFFPNLQCQVSNCIFTENRYLLDGDYSRFDAVLFTEQALLDANDRPDKRRLSQIYIFTTIESAYNFPACELFNDDFYNWTFTYRLDSDLLWSYFMVRNSTRDVVAPSKHVNWHQYASKEISPGIQEILRRKTKAAAWLVSHCKADSLRDDYLTRLQEHLFHFSLKLDVYGDCSAVKCINDNCEEMIANDYYFYMAFENSFSEDYVTEKVLHGYDNYAVPIVYGGANYSRFLPPGSYLNARELHPYNLAFLIHEAIVNPVKYQEYFAWTNEYTVDSKLPGYHPLCSLCAALNSNQVNHTRTYRRFRRWWNGRNGMKWCLSNDYWNETSRLNVNDDFIQKMY